MQHDEVLDLAIDLLCCRQFQTVLDISAQVSRQLDDGPWFDLLSELAMWLPEGGDPTGVYRAEQRLISAAASVLGEATHHAPRLRRLRHAAGSTMRRVQGHAHIVQPTVLHGPGTLILGEGCQFGHFRSPGSASGVGYIDCRHPDGVISIGARTILNNDFTITSQSSDGIRIGADCLVGVGVRIIDTDGHGIAPDQRRGSFAAKAPVVIEDNVWLGNGVSVFKGVTIGRDSVVAANAVVNKSVPPGSITGGVPARVVGSVHG